ncbi:hypothetical protein [Glycomyces sp. NPDC047010]|uniref:hypothetical protein n=1 Tax=Glycomyces sp. NPDC047010 TaxID=3155023 RepID=UPI0033DA5A76
MSTNDAVVDTAPPLAKSRRTLVFVAILLGMVMAALDLTIVSTALSTIVADSTPPTGRSWTRPSTSWPANS